MTKFNITCYFLLFSLVLSHGLINANVLPTAERAVTDEKATQVKENFSLSALAGLLDDPLVKKLMNNDAQKNEGFYLIFNFFFYKINF
jgi:hypothetical protein